MATMALPLREMSVKVQREAVTAQTAYWRLAEDLAHKRFEVILWLKIRTLKYSMASLIKNQELLINCLQNSRTEMFTPVVFGKVANDLDNVVSLVNSFLDEVYDMPDECLGVWSTRLERISELNGHLDNFAESFRIASDQKCTDALANVALGVMERKAVPAL